MSLLREIQQTAMSEVSPLATLLRRCLVLAARLNSEELTSWVRAELNGYGADAELPAYRMRSAQIRGTLRAGLETAKNVPIPIYQLPEDIRTTLASVCFRDGVASLERIAQSEKLSLNTVLPAEAAMLIGGSLGEHVHCISVYRVIAVQDVVEILDTVRTRVLDFALELEKSYPEAAQDDEALSHEPPRATIHQLFVTLVVGNRAEHLVVGSEQNITGSTVGAVAQGAAAVANGQVNIASQGYEGERTTQPNKPMNADKGP